MRLLRLLVVAVVLVVAAKAEADMFQPRHACHKPYKPFRFNSKSEVDRFKDDVDTYERCIKSFVREQREAAKQHSQAANDAVEDWNSFVNVELR